MTTYARVIGNVIQEVFVPLPGFTIEESFTPEVAAMFQVVPDSVKAGYYWDGSKWNKP